MRKIIWLVILAPAACLFASSGSAVRITRTPVTGFEKSPLRTPLPVSPPVADVPETYFGKVDTIGGSTYDVQFNGAPWQTIYFDSNYGLHAVWMFSTDLGTAYPDRNMRYNFLPKGDTAWRFNYGVSFMDNGYNAFTERAGFGMLDVNATDGIEYIDAHQDVSGVFYCSVVRDEEGPGQGGFVACTGEPSMDGYGGPAMGITASGKTHVVAASDDTGASAGLFHTTVDPWCTWSDPARIASSAYAYNIAASKKSNRIAVSWVTAPETGLWVGYYKTSTDDGVTWSDSIVLHPPDVYSAPPDTAPMFWLTSLYPYFDNSDSLHFAATVNKMIQESLVSTTESAIADWSSELGWRIICLAKSETIVTHGGTFYEPYADRVSMALSGTDSFVAVWEQFDGRNIEPATNESRSDIWAAFSEDGGVTWTDPYAVARGGTVSRRFPCAASSMDRKYVDIIYLQDCEAGPAVPPQSLGNPTVNAVIQQRFPAWFPGVSEAQHSRPGSYLCRANPSVFQGSTRISYTLPQAGKIDLKVYDAAGRQVRTLVNARADPGRYSVTWNGLTGRNVPASPGVYFCALRAGKTSVTEKLTLLP